jgi:iron complex outermembrane recepter protein
MRQAKLGFAATLCVAISAPLVALSQQVETTAESEPRAVTRSPERSIEEITVTARKRAEPLQDTPIAITAFSADTIKDLDIRSLQDINDSTPNLQIDKAVGQAASSRVYLRGVGNGDAISSDDPGVGIYIDGVYLPRAQGSLLAVADIAQVEVLRGPQGTLFGKNTIGGAINVTTVKPSYEFGGNAELRLGYLGQVETRGAVNIPLLPEMAAMRISFATATNRGYTRNRFLGNRTSDEKMLAGRIQLLVNPTPTSEFILSLDHSREPRSATSAKCKVIPDGAGLLQGGLFRFIAPEVQAGCEQDDARSDREVVQDGKAEDSIRTYGTTLLGTIELGDNLTFKTTTAWRRNKTSRFFDADGTQFNIAQDQRELGGDSGEQDAISQEFNLSGVSMGGRLKWTSGAYWFYETNQDNNSAAALGIAEELGAFTTADIGSPELNRDGLLAGIAAGIATPAIARGIDLSGVRLIPQEIGATRTFNGVADCVPDADGNPIDIGTAFGGAPNGLCAAVFRSVPTMSFFKTNQTSYAGYGELTYDFTDALSLTAGLRFTHERKRVAEQTIAVRGEGVLGAGRINEPSAGSIPGGVQFTDNYELSSRFDKWTPRAILQYRFNDDVNVYASWSRGFKSGTFSRASDGVPPPDVKPEVLTTYELGLKSQLFDNRLTANVAGYMTYYDDVQLTRVAAGADGVLRVVTQNAGEARILGGELELRAVPLPGLVLSSQIGVTSARYTKFDARPNAKLPGTPALTMTYSATYTTPFLGLGDLRTTVRWFHEGKKGSDILDPHFTRVNKHGLLSGRVALELYDGKTEIAIVGKNLLNREYFANAIDITGSVGTTLRYYAPGRALSIELRRQF